MLFLPMIPVFLILNEEVIQIFWFNYLITFIFHQLLVYQALEHLQSILILWILPTQPYVPRLQLKIYFFGCKVIKNVIQFYCVSLHLLTTSLIMLLMYMEHSIQMQQQQVFLHLMGLPNINIEFTSFIIAVGAIPMGKLI